MKNPITKVKTKRVHLVKAKTIPIYIGSTMWDDSLRAYRRMTWGDRMRTEVLFNKKIMPRCFPSGYRRDVQLLPAWEGDLQDDPALDPMVDLLTRVIPEDSAVRIFEMAFGPLGQRFTWMERYGWSRNDDFIRTRLNG
jgi:hypothetical protein